MSNIEKYKDAQELLRRFGEKQARLLLLRQRIKTAEQEEIRTREELTKMETHVLAAASYLEANPVPPPPAPESEMHTGRVPGYRSGELSVTQFGGPRAYEHGQRLVHKVSKMQAVVTFSKEDEQGIRYQVQTVAGTVVWWPHDDAELAPLAAGERVSWVDGSTRTGHVTKRIEISTHLDRDLYEVEPESDLQNHVTIGRSKLIPIERFQAGHGG